ncbi:signal recognition particle-docking protein FtsY [Tepidicaulis marinus]|uniref:Signal recognition particle receptor FtsY n=1 Tax=Tepidicaulis marinus TaxID=1333998 RepID=A0A081B893_9HYPH|nr:signal recognition particle-docking protein FtsY [Tepidicaulis marinus]
MSEHETNPEKPEKKSLFKRMKEGLQRSTQALSEGVSGIFTKRKLDGETLQELEDLLIMADMGLDQAAAIAEAVGKGRYNKEVSPEEIREILAEEIAAVLAPVEKPFEIDSSKKPFIVLVTGVNGSGKTTTIGKIGAKLKAEGKSVMFAAGDTFRAAAIDQLKIWGERIGAPVVETKVGGDAAGLAFEAIDRAKAEGTDVLLIDTAGRLQNKAGLMAELEKVVRVIKKRDPEAPHLSLLVLDATTGQNAINQVEVFKETAGLTGLIMTKLDGTARGGILVALAGRFGLPVHLIGVGEGIDDLQSFNAKNFARAITGAQK